MTSNNSNKRDTEERVCVLEPPIENTGNAKMFGDKRRADVAMKVPGHTEPLMLHSLVLAAKSRMFDKVLYEEGTCPCVRVENTKGRVIEVEWIESINNTSNKTDPEKTATEAEREGTAVVNVLKLCYGMVVSVPPWQCGPMLWVMDTMEVDNETKTTTAHQLKKWMVEQATHDTVLGVKLLRDCAMFEEINRIQQEQQEQQEPQEQQEESDGKDEKEKEESVLSQTITELAECVMTQTKTKEQWEVVVEDGLMELPPRFVLATQFGNEHEKFAVVRRFVKFNEKQLSKKTQKQMLRQCDLSLLGHGEVEQLCRLGVLSDKELVRVLCSVVGNMEQKLKEQTAMTIQAQRNCDDALNALQEEQTTRQNEQEQHKAEVQRLSNENKRLKKSLDEQQAIQEKLWEGAKKQGINEICAVLKMNIEVAQQLDLRCEHEFEEMRMENNECTQCEQSQSQTQTDNDIGEAGARALCDALKTNTTLQQLNLYGEHEFEEMRMKNNECTQCEQSQSQTQTANNIGEATRKALQETHKGRISF